MSEQDAWQLSNDAAVAYERDFVPALFAQWPPIMAEIAEIGAGDRVLDVAAAPASSRAARSPASVPPGR